MAGDTPLNIGTTTASPGEPHIDDLSAIIKGNPMNSGDKGNPKYAAVLSFAGEDRQIAARLAKLLRGRDISVFYDKYEQASLWGKDLYEHVADVYSNQAHSCIMLISASYAKKAWTSHERKNAQARAFREHREYILPVRLDDTTIPGIRETIGYIDFRQSSIGEIADLVQQKLGRSKIRPVQSASRVRKAPSKKREDAVPLPKIRRDFTQREKDKFLREAFTFTKQYFKKSVSETGKSYPEIETDFLEVNSIKFICKIYFRGDIKSQCKIWLVDSAPLIQFAIMKRNSIFIMIMHIMIGSGLKMMDSRCI
jgi:TIR domain